MALKQIVEWLPRRLAIRNRAKQCEVLNPVPLELLSGTQKPLTIREEMRRVVREEMSRQAVQEGSGSFEDEDDFEEDEYAADLVSGYTVFNEEPLLDGDYSLDPSDDSEESEIDPPHPPADALDSEQEPVPA